MVIYLYSLRSNNQSHDNSILTTELINFAASEYLAFEMTLITEYVRLYACSFILSLLIFICNRGVLFGGTCFLVICALLGGIED